MADTIIEVQNLGAHIEAVLDEIHDTVIRQNTEKGRFLDLPDYVDFSVVVLAEGGTNAVERRSESFTDGDKTSEQITPAHVEKRVQGAVETVTTREPTTTTRKSESSRSEGQSTSVDTRTQTSNQQQQTFAGGSDTVTTTYEYE